MGQDALTINLDADSIKKKINQEMVMASGVRLKATQSIGRPITWAQINLEASEDLRGLMRRNRTWA